MLYFLVVKLIPGYQGTPLRLFDYVTFRAAAAAMTALMIALLLGPFTVRMLKRLRAAAPQRLEGLVDEKFIDRNKDKTPSMGGILVVGSIVCSTLLWANLENSLARLFLATICSFSLLGFLDDYAKIAHAKRDGISGKMKLMFQFLISFTAVLYVYGMPDVGDYLCDLCVPFIKTPVWTMPLVCAVLFCMLVVVASSNAVNLTDGKDGLAVGCTIFCVLAYGAFAYMAGHRIFAEHFNLNYLPGCGEVVVFAAAIAGSCIGFLWHNCYPASMFMGDTGSLALGGVIGLIAVLVNQELLLLIVGGIFVMEAASVMMQVTSFKLTGKRIFLCTPIHHHFEQKGWTETQIVIRFWILAGIFALIGMATLKLR